jgi:hypothetical protein
MLNSVMEDPQLPAQPQSIVCKMADGAALIRPTTLNLEAGTLFRRGLFCVYNADPLDTETACR